MVEVGSSIVGEEVQSKFRVLERPTLHPGRCACCGAANRPVVEFGVEVDFEADGYGRLMLCVTCILQAASKFPQPTPSVDELNEDWRRKLNSDRVWIANELRELANRYSLGVAIPVYGSPDSVPRQTEPEDPASTEREPKSSGGITVENSNTASSEGPTSVSGNSSDGDILSGLIFRDL